MNVKNIYCLYGYINMDGTYVNNPKYKTYIAECKTGNDTGFSFYAFYTVKNNEKDKDINYTSLIKLESLSDLITDSTICIKRLDEASIYKKYFELIYYSQERFLSEETERKKI